MSKRRPPRQEEEEEEAAEPQPSQQFLQAQVPPPRLPAWVHPSPRDLQPSPSLIPIDGYASDVEGWSDEELRAAYRQRERDRWPDAVDWDPYEVDEQQGAVAVPPSAINQFPGIPRAFLNIPEG